MKYIAPRNASIAVSTISLGIIAFIIITQSKSILYDEAYFVPNIHLLQQFGLTEKFLMNISGSPGPTYAVIHYFFIGITHFNIKYIRLSNFALLLVLLWYIYLIARLLKASDPLIVAANFIFVPMVWVSCGLALTEIPAMLCAVMSLYFFLQCFKGRCKFISKIIFAALAGVFLSFAVLGRSFFLMVDTAILACLVISSFLMKFDISFYAGFQKSQFEFRNKNKFLTLLGIFLLFSLALPIKVFTDWGALAPPKDTSITGANNLTLVPWYGVLSFCYCGFVTLILAPDWFVVNKKLFFASLIACIAFLIINVYTGYFEFAPFLSASSKFLKPGNFILYQRITPAFVFVFAFHFLLSSGARIWENRHNPVFTCLGLIILLMALSAIKIKSQFSSRYVAQITPYFLLIFIPFERTDWQKVLRVAVGASLGFISLYFYYHNA